MLDACARLPHPQTMGDAQALPRGGGDRRGAAFRRTSGSGYGAKSLGAEVANSEGFSRCQVRKVFKQVCFRDPTEKDDLDEVEVIRSNFEANGYDLMDVFAEVAAYCTAGL